MKPFLSPHAIDHYRPDIDGLRAFAVLSVVLYHAFPKVVTGGYVGVDVFFVISGFLISKILFAEISEHRFSFTSFYGRRIRRIFPALAVCLAAVLAIGFVSLMASELAQLGKHVFFGAGFLSNIAMERKRLFRRRRQFETAFASMVFGHRRAVLHPLAGIAMGGFPDEGKGGPTSGRALSGLLRNQHRPVHLQHCR